ncbi:MAG: ATP-binding protein [Acidobacteriota bacterium]
MNTDRHLARQLHWLIAIRLVMVTSVVLPYFLLQLAPSEQPALEEALPSGPSEQGPVRLRVETEPRVDTRLLYLIAGLTYLASLVYIVLLRLLSGRYRTQAYIQFSGDLFLVTLLVYFFGGIESPFSILYLLVIAVATSTLRQRSTGVATVAFVLYATLQVALYEGWLIMPDGTVILQDFGTVRRLVYNLAVHLFAFYAVTLLTWFLVSNVARAERELVAKTEAMADLEMRYRDVVQSITSGLITTDRIGRVTSLNRAGRQILRQSESELLGRHVCETGIIARDQWQRFARTSGGAGRLESEIRVEREKDPIYVGFSLAELEDADGHRTGSIVIFQDLTPWRKLEEQVRRKDRMAAVGTLAAGLAHEIGNPLASISGSVQMLSRTIDDHSPEHRLVGILLKESQRLDRTIKNFLEYARPGRRTPVEFDVAHLLSENFELLENSSEVGAGHRLHLRIDPPSVHIQADPDGVSQIFWNLAKNSLKAMPEGGDLIVVGQLLDGVYEIEIQDTGKGMTEEERANLFHPFKSFFDQGTGLGMAIVYRIVQDHGGELLVDSRPGARTRITVRLPLEAERAEEPSDRDAPGTEPGRAAGDRALEA